MAVSGTITVPDPDAFGSFKEMTTQVSFFVIVRNPCRTSLFEAFTLADITVSPGEQVSSIQLPQVRDSASQENGNMDGLTFCGDRAFGFVDPTSVPSFLTIDGQNNLVFGEIAAADLGTYTIDVQVQLA